MELKEFMETATRIACDTPTQYMSGGVGQHRERYFLFDCIGLIKSILWGFNFDYDQYRGGAIYESNSVPDLNADDFFNQCCYDKSSDMSNIEEGELVYMRGHIGIYANNGNVYEATSAGTNNVLVSNIINGDGTRVVDGKYIYKWTAHAKCNFINYKKPEPQPEPKPQPTPVDDLKVGDKVEIISTGKATIYGEDPTAYGIGWHCTISKIYEGYPYPYRVDDEEGAIGFYQKDALKKI